MTVRWLVIIVPYILLLPNTSKILERLVYNHIVKHVLCLISPIQFGLIQGRSTTHANRYYHF